GAACQLHGGAGVFQGEVVQQSDVGTPGNDLLELGQGLHLDLELEVRAQGAGAGDGGSDAARGGDVVLLDQKGIVQTQAVIAAAAAAHRVLLGRPQPGHGLAGVEQDGGGAGDE